jgi:hypothetical protein
MSLDVSLYGPETVVQCTCPRCDNKHTTKDREVLFSSNITHNLGKMAEAAQIYKHLWKPEELGIKKARELIVPLGLGLIALKSDPEKFKKFDSPNGWGLYENFVPWVEEYLRACEEYPDAEIEANR